MIIIGASSFIGKHLYEHYFEKEKSVIGTYYSNYKKDLIKFDIKNPNILNFGANLKKHKYAFICSAMSHPDICKRNIKESYEINVKGTKKLLEQLLNEGIFPFFFSSEYVFNGEKGNYSENDERNSNTVYGNQKKEIEDFLIKSDKPFFIARLGKVFGVEKEDKTIVTSIIEKLLHNENLRCATDQIFCPTYIGDLVNILDISIERKLKGLYNVASPEIFSRYELAKFIKSHLNLDYGRIIPCSIKEIDFLDNRPLNTSLNSEKIKEDTDFKFTELKYNLDKLKNIYSLC